VPEVSKEALIDSLVTAHREATSDDDFETRAYAAFRDRTLSISQVYECPRCHRLAVFRDASDQTPINWYKPEAPGEPIAKPQN
jgi:hypothetical protein